MNWSEMTYRDVIYLFCFLGLGFCVGYLVWGW